MQSTIHFSPQNIVLLLQRRYFKAHLFMYWRGLCTIGAYWQRVSIPEGWTSGHFSGGVSIKSRFLNKKSPIISRRCRMSAIAGVDKGMYMGYSLYSIYRYIYKRQERGRILKNSAGRKKGEGRISYRWLGWRYSWLSRFGSPNGWSCWR